MSSSTNAYEMAQAQFDKVADQLGLDQQVRDYLRYQCANSMSASPYNG